MSNWTTLTIDDLKAVAFGGIIDAAQATATGANDPVAEAIADAVATVRGAISTGNTLDQDSTTIPRSLRPLAARTAVFALMERVQLDLSRRSTRHAAHGPGTAHPHRRSATAFRVGGPSRRERGNADGRDD